MVEKEVLLVEESTQNLLSHKARKREREGRKQVSISIDKTTTTATTRFCKRGRVWCET